MTPKKRNELPRGFRILRGRLQMKRPEHPLARGDGWVWQHRQVLYDAIGPGAHPCHWCGHIVDWVAENHDDRLTVDHVDFDKHNNSLDNLVPSCSSCNSCRGDGRREEWMPTRIARRLKAQYMALPSLRAGAVPGEHTAAHSCGNCEGIDPATCINAPRPPASKTEETTPRG